MKHIQLKTVTVNNSAVPAGFTLNYRREYLQLLEVAPDGLTVGEMGDLIKVIQKLRAIEDDGLLRLEDAEWNAFKSRVERAKFQFVASEIVDLISTVINAPTVVEAYRQEVE